MRTLIIISFIILSLNGLSGQDIEWNEIDLQGVSKITQIDSIFLISEMHIQESIYTLENGQIVSKRTNQNGTLISELKYKYSEAGATKELNWYEEGRLSSWLWIKYDVQGRILERRQNAGFYAWENDVSVLTEVKKTEYFKDEYEYFDGPLFSITEYLVTEDDIDETAVTYFEYDSLNRVIEKSYFSDDLTLGYFKPNSSDINNIDTAFYNTKGQYTYYEYSEDTTLVYSMSNGKRVLKSYEIVNSKNKITELAYLDKDGPFLKFFYKYINESLLDHYKREIIDLDRMTFDYIWMDELKISYNSSNLPISKIEYADGQIIRSTHYFYIESN